MVKLGTIKDWEEVIYTVKPLAAKYNAENVCIYFKNYKN
jgi:hypothetical protein